jgi:hypothetical protein
MGVELHSQSLCGAVARHRPGRRVAGKPSYRYHWDDLDFRTCRSLGVIARRAPNGAPCFNFPQTVWLSPKLRMDWSVRLTPAVQTLAVNVLTLWTVEQDLAACFGRTNRRAVAAADRFAGAFLLTMPDSGGCLPRELIMRWIREEI